MVLSEEHEEVERECEHESRRSKWAKQRKWKTSRSTLRCKTKR